jgi:hypothetical protein
MAKLTRHTTGKVANVITITAVEVEALLREKFPVIPADAGMEVDTDLSDRLGLEGITFRWEADTSEPERVEDLKPAGSGCQRECPRARLAEAAERESNE